MVAPMTSKLVSLVDRDPDLAALVAPGERPAARRRARARVEVIEPGAWSVQPLRDPRAFGMLVLDGLVGARVSLGEEAHLEVLGEGDVLRPWVHLEPEASVPSRVGWQVFDQMRVAVLDAEFARAVAPWPQLAAGLMHRLVLRARRLSFQLALAGISRIDERVLIALWHFGDRWGRMTPEGVVVRLALTQADLAEVVRAARSTVSTAVADLRREGSLSYDRAERTWTLRGEPPPTAMELKEQVGL
jgi:Crp-like helix-turn-helix domain